MLRGRSVSVVLFVFVSLIVTFMRYSPDDVEAVIGSVKVLLAEYTSLRITVLSRRISYLYSYSPLPPLAFAVTTTSLSSPITTSFLLMVELFIS